MTNVHDKNIAAGGDVRAYYDEFSKVYDRPRREGYHAWLDTVTAAALRRYAEGASVLEVGCGTGLIMERIAPQASRLVGLELSPEMAKRARQRGFTVVGGTATDLPFEDAEFDFTYSVKVMAHVPELRRALEELARVTRPGGVVAVDFYNRWSQRYWLKRFLGPQSVTSELSEGSVFTRWVAPPELAEWLPASLSVEGVLGLRVVTPIARVHDVPVVRSCVAGLEWVAARSPLRWFGGFLLVILRRL